MKHSSVCAGELRLDRGVESFEWLCVFQISADHTSVSGFFILLFSHFHLSSFFGQVLVSSCILLVDFLLHSRSIVDLILAELGYIVSGVIQTLAVGGLLVLELVVFTSVIKFIKRCAN